MTVLSIAAICRSMSLSNGAKYRDVWIGKELKSWVNRGLFDQESVRSTDEMVAVSVFTAQREGSLENE